MSKMIWNKVVDMLASGIEGKTLWHVLRFYFCGIFLALPLILYQAIVKVDWGPLPIAFVALVYGIIGITCYERKKKINVERFNRP